jgi:hypothetical protein
MGLLDLLQGPGSNLTAYNGVTPSINPLATNASQMHDNYSITGDSFNVVNADYQQYLDGTANFLPTPSNLDLGGTPPSISPSGQSLPYLNNLPG